MMDRRSRSDALIAYAVIARSTVTKHPSFVFAAVWIASRSLSSGAHSRDPLARNDVGLLRRFRLPARFRVLDVELAHRAGNDEIIVIEHQRPRDAVLV